MPIWQQPSLGWLAWHACMSIHKEQFYCRMVHMKLRWRTSVACSSLRLLLAAKCWRAWLSEGVGGLARRLGAKGRCLAKRWLVVRATKGRLRLCRAILLLACPKCPCRGNNVMCESPCIRAEWEWCSHRGKCSGPGKEFSSTSKGKA